MTVNRFFILTLGLSLIALPFCLFNSKWYDIQPGISASFELLCGIFGLCLYVRQPELKRTYFMHVVIGFVLAFLVANFIDAWLYSAISLANHGEKDHLIAARINSWWKNYIALYVVFSGAFAILIMTYLFVFVSTGQNNFRR